MREEQHSPNVEAPEAHLDHHDRFLAYAKSLEVHGDPHDALLDTYGIQLDGLLGRIHAAEAYFDEFPGVDAIRVPVNPPMHGNEDGAESAHFDLHRDTIFTLKEMAFARYEDLTELSGLGHELAADIVKSWDVVTFSWNQLMEEGK